MEIPNGHQGVIPYLAMDEAGDFLDFVEKVFDAKLTYPDERPTEFKGHFEVSISGCTVMFSNTSEKCKPAPANLFVYVEDADQIYNSALENGAASLMPPEDTHYGRSGGVKDVFGNEWWMTTIINK
jgi:uncharacterized glyoxalase superfamily protein PhnB